MTDQTRAIGAEARAPDVGGDETGHDAEPRPVAVVTAEEAGEGTGRVIGVRKGVD